MKIGSASRHVISKFPFNDFSGQKIIKRRFSNHNYRLDAVNENILNMNFANEVPEFAYCYSLKTDLIDKKLSCGYMQIKYSMYLMSTHSATVPSYHHHKPHQHKLMVNWLLNKLCKLGT